MLKRLIVGLFLGAIVGAVLAAILVQGLHVMSFDASALGAAGAYLAAAVTGVATGLVAGKPIWSADGKIEAGLKAFFGALLALGGMFVLRQWVHTSVDLTTLKASEGAGEIGQLPALSLPIIAAVLAAFFEIDNSGAGDKDKDGMEKKGAADAVDKKKVRVAAREDTDDAPQEDGDEKQEKQEEEQQRSAKKRR